MRSALLSLLLAAGCGADRAPGPSLIRISPPVPTTTDDLVVKINTDAVDPEGDSVDYRFRWYRDDELQTDYGQGTLPAEATAKGERWRVEVIAVAEGLEGPPVLAEVSVVNSAPRVTLGISPEEPLSDEDIVVTATEEDPDGDAVQLDWTWTRNGVETAYTGATIPAVETQRWETWQVTVLPYDGAEYGEPAIASVVIGNAPPVVESVSLEPAEAYEDTLLEASAVASDFEGDLWGMSYAWYVDGDLVPDVSSATLDGTWFDKHQQVQVQVTVSDPYESAEPVMSDPVTILNSAPQLTTATLKPTELYEGSTVTCVGSDLTDIDGDDLSLSYSWLVNGSEVSSAESIDGSLFDRGDTVACSLGADDGEVVGPTVQSETATVLNAPPVVPSVVLSPSAPAAGDTITASVATPVDDDGDPVTLGYAWYVDGSFVSTATELSGAFFSKHQDIHLEVTPHDGFIAGSPTASATVTAVNTPPVFTDLSTDPTTAPWGEIITALPSGWSDADGDAESYQYTWYVDGSAAGSDASLDLTPYDRGSEVWVEVTADDGDDPGTTLTSDVLVITRLLFASDADLIFEGDAGDNAGMAISLSEDLTGDGIPDILVGAPGNNNEAQDAGGVYLVAGDLSGTIDPSQAEAFLWGTEADEEAGWSVSTLGDVDNDGHGDFIVGVPNDSTFASTSGAAFVVLGPHSGDQELGTAGYAILGTTSGERMGWAVAGAGDVDSDGFDDILVGAYGRSSSTGAAFLAYGPFSSTHYSTSMDVMMSGESSGDQAGCAVAHAGDVDSDGYDDILVGADTESSVYSENGAAYLLYGPPPSSGGLSMADAKLTGEADWDNAGYAVAGAGDIDGDGADDILVGSRWEDSGGSAAGACYLITRAVSGTTSLSTAQAKLIGDSVNQLAANAVSGLGDIDGDGHDDLVVGAEGDASLGTNTGAAFVLLGPLTGTISLRDQAWATIQADALGDKLGWAVAGGQDLDDDGTPDLVVGAPYQDGNGTSSGAVFLFSGAEL
jgi:hypothetical protein